MLITEAMIACFTQEKAPGGMPDISGMGGMGM